MIIMNQRIEEIRTHLDEGTVNAYLWDANSCSEDIIAYRPIEKPFEPITLEITCNTLDEAQHMWHRLNVSDHTIWEASGKEYVPSGVTAPESAYTAWNELDNILTSEQKKSPTQPRGVGQVGQQHNTIVIIM